MAEMAQHLHRNCGFALQASEGVLRKKRCTRHIFPFAVLAGKTAFLGV